MRLRSNARARGFTLLEILVAVSILLFVVMFVYAVLQNAVRGQNMVRQDLRRPKIQNAILGQIFRDFRYLYWDGFTGDAGFIGRDHTISGKDADSIDFVTARFSRTAQKDQEGVRDARPSPLTEVGYACRINDDNSDYLELYRREDWFVDDNPVRGGKYTLIYDRITKFSLQYFAIPEMNFDNEAVKTWDTRTKNMLPYAIVLEILFDVDEDDVDDEESEERLSRIILLKGAYNVKRQTGAPGQDPK